MERIRFTPSVSPRVEKGRFFAPEREALLFELR
jgi:hypothetical protein